MTTGRIGTCRQCFEFSRCTTVLSVVWGLGYSLVLREEGEEVTKNYKTGSFEICAAEQTIFG